MKTVLNIFSFILSIIGAIIGVSLWRYIKRHEGEKLELHHAYICSRCAVIMVLVIAANILKVIAVFL